VRSATLELNTTRAPASATVGGVSFNYSTPERLDFFALAAIWIWP